MVIDTHVHLFAPENRADPPEAFAGEGPFLDLEFSRPDLRAVWQRGTRECLLEEMEAGGIDRAVVFGFPWNSPDRCEADNRYIAQCAREADGRLLWLAVFQPSDPERALAGLAPHWDDPRFLGVKIKAQFQGHSLADPTLWRPVLAEVARHGKLALVHVQQPINPAHGNGPCELLALLRAFPQLRVIAAHFGGMLGMYSTFPPVRDALGNVVFDTALGMTAGEVAAAYVQFGLGERLVFGSDFPMHSPSRIVGDLRRTLPGTALRDVLGANFLRICPVLATGAGPG